MSKEKKKNTEVSFTLGGNNGEDEGLQAVSGTVEPPEGPHDDHHEERKDSVPSLISSSSSSDNCTLEPKLKWVPTKLTRPRNNV